MKEQVIKSRDARLSDPVSGILLDIATSRISGILQLNGTSDLSHRVATGQGKVREIQGQGKVREF